MDATSQVLERCLLWGFLPVWLLAGLADWACHRAERIERSAGLKESTLHLAMIGELGLGVLAVLWLQVNAAVLVLLLAVCVAHELTMWWDLRYASSKRLIPIAEQWVHGVQMVLPWVGVVTLAIVYREQALAVLGWNERMPDWALRWREPPLPVEAKAAVLLGAVLLVVLPFLQEWQRCRRVGKAPG
jgi:hypothetical protein